MTRDEIIRLPAVVSVLQKIHFSYSTCGICGLPWNVCDMEHIDINDNFGVFYICPYCFKTKTLKEVIEATSLGYLRQYESISSFKDRADFLKTHDLAEILEKTQEKYLEMHKNDCK